MDYNLEFYMVWPDGTVYEYDEDTPSHLSDDYIVVSAESEVHALQSAIERGFI